MTKQRRVLRPGERSEGVLAWLGYEPYEMQERISLGKRVGEVDGLFEGIEREQSKIAVVNVVSVV